MYIAICDDEQQIIDKLKNLIPDCGAKIYTFNSGSQLLSSSIIFDIVLLDIEMQEPDGLAVAAEIFKNHKNTLIIFITSHNEYSTKGYEFRAFRYVLKSEPDEFITRNIQDAIDEYFSCNFFIDVAYKGEIARVSSAQIIYTESFGHTIIVHTADKSYVGQNKFKDICQALKPYGFIQCHKSYMVNMRFIVSITRSLSVNLSVGGSIPIGRKYSNDTISAYLAFNDRRM